MDVLTATLAASRGRGDAGGVARWSFELKTLLARHRDAVTRYAAREGGGAVLEVDLSCGRARGAARGGGAGQRSGALGLAGGLQASLVVLVPAGYPLSSPHITAVDRCGAVAREHLSAVVRCAEETLRRVEATGGPSILSAVGAALALAAEPAPERRSAAAAADLRALAHSPERRKTKSKSDLESLASTALPPSELDADSDVRTTPPQSPGDEVPLTPSLPPAAAAAPLVWMLTPIPAFPVLAAPGGSLQATPTAQLLPFERPRAQPARLVECRRGHARRPALRSVSSSTTMDSGSSSSSDSSSSEDLGEFAEDVREVAAELVANFRRSLGRPASRAHKGQARGAALPRVYA